MMCNKVPFFFCEFKILFYNRPHTIHKVKIDDQMIILSKQNL